MENQRNPLRLNVGFITKQSVGYGRVFPFKFRKICLPPDLELENLAGGAEISRTPQGLLVQGSLQAILWVECVKCLTQFQLNLDTQFTELFAILEKNSSESGLILPEDGHIDLGPIARECLIVAIPINPICRLDCKGLCLVCGENLNETECNHDIDDVDPRLSVLRKLIPES